MTDSEKIEKLLDHIYNFEEALDCDDLFGDVIYEDDGKWCEEHCGTKKEIGRSMQCYKHFLLGE